MGLFGKLFGDKSKPDVGGGEDHWVVGNCYVLAGKGLVTLTFVDDEKLVCEQDEETIFRLDAVQAAGKLRPSATREEAEALLTLLRQRQVVADGRPIGQRSVSYRRTLRGLDFDKQVATLSAMYSHPTPEYPEQQHIPRYEELIFTELGYSLGRSRKAIKAMVRSAVLDEKPPRSLDAAERSAELCGHTNLPEFAPYQAIAAFSTEGELGVGETGQDLTIKAKPGVWYAYQRPYFDEEDGGYDNGDFDRMVAVHHLDVSQFEELERSAAEEGNEMPIEGARMAIMDAGFAADEEFQSELQYGGEVVQGRAVQVFLGGDGAGRARVARDGDAAVFVVVDM